MIREVVKQAISEAEFVFAKALSRWRRSDVAVFHQFAPPPSGGGHQFLRALCQEFERRGLKVENNTISPSARACLFNSFNFDFQRLRRFRREGCVMAHRVDGPIGVYRGNDDGTDNRIWEINQELADVTIFQSGYSLRKHLELGMRFKSPCVIHNAVDSRVFHSRGREPFDRRRKIRLISSSWSDNPNKGAAVYQWLEEHLDWDRFDYTFVGRSPVAFKRIRRLAPVTSREMAGLLRQHDVYVTASLHDPCSNALLEALACGLPALYIRSGGHPELAGEAGLGFESREEIPALLDKLADGYEACQAAIHVASMESVGGEYLRAMRLA